MKFDYCIGNPPYQAENENNHRNPPVYHSFMDAAYTIADKVELITPARFLFNAGQTPKNWNEKMLNDEHFKVLSFEKDGSVVFPNNDIKGGVVISLRDATKKFGKIGIFIDSKQLNDIVNKVKPLITHSLTEIANPKSYWDSEDYNGNSIFTQTYTLFNSFLSSDMVAAEVSNDNKNYAYDVYYANNASYYGWKYSYSYNRVGANYSDKCRRDQMYKVTPCCRVTLTKTS